MKDTRGLEHGVVLMNHSPHIHSRDMHGECQAWHFTWIQERRGRVLEMTFDVKWEKEAWTLVNIVTAYPPDGNVWRRLSVTLCVASTSMRARTRPICTHGMNKRCCGGCIIVCVLEPRVGRRLCRWQSNGLMMVQRHHWALRSRDLTQHSFFCREQVQSTLQT